MLNKLAFRNAKKSMRDYSVYFFTLVMGVCIFYLFNSIYAQQEIMAVTQTTNESMQLLQKVLSYISVFVAAVLGFLIVYANRFFIRRRKKELGIYLTLGMSRSKVSTVLVLETCLLALAALVVGLVLGVFGSQVMSVFTAKIFEADLTGYRFVFSLGAVGKSILYFGLIFAVVMVFNIYTVGKCRLIDLLYGGRKNETNIFPKFHVSLLLFVAAVILLGAAYGLILWNGMLDLNIWFSLSLVFGVLGTLLFYYALAGILLAALQKNKKFYFRGLNMFVLRQMGNKINTNFMSVSVVCLTLLLVIGVFSCGYSVQNVLSKDLQRAIPYDFSLYHYYYDDSEDNRDESLVSQLPDDIMEDEGITGYAEFSVFRTDMVFGDFELDFGMAEDIGIRRSHLEFIPLSQYNQMMELCGQAPLELSDTEYAISASERRLKPVAMQMLEKKTEIVLGNSNLTPVTVLETPSSNNSFQIELIVRDELLTDLTSTQRILNIQCADTEAAENLNEKLDRYQRTEPNPAFSFYFSKLEMYAQSVTTKALVSFLGIYLGFVFMIVSAAILAIQQLSETADNRERYLLLKKLGTEPAMLNRALFTQILCYFLFPLLLAVIHSIVGLTAANEVIRMFGKIDVAGTIAATAVFVLVIYGVYFGLTYLGSRRILSKE